MMNFHRIVNLSTLSALLLGLSSISYAQDYDPESASMHPFEASPDVYEVVAENDHYRVIVATWQPGQRDNWHTHHGEIANFTLTDCHASSTMPDGRVVEVDLEKGVAGFAPAGSTHFHTNLGDDVCSFLLVEMK